MSGGNGWVEVTISLGLRGSDGKLTGAMTYEGTALDIEGWTKAGDAIVRCRMRRAPMFDNGTPIPDHLRIPLLDDPGVFPDIKF